MQLLLLSITLFILQYYCILLGFAQVPCMLRLPCHNYTVIMRLNKQPLGSLLLTNTVHCTSRPGAELA